MGGGVEGREVQHRRVPIAAEGHVLDLVLAYYHGPFPAPERVGAVFLGYALALPGRVTAHHITSHRGASWKAAGALHEVSAAGAAWIFRYQ